MKTIVRIVAALVIAGSLAAPAVAQQCPAAFRLRGSGTDKLWKKVTNTAWNNMLPDKWVDKGFHFYSRVRTRGPALGISTPSDLESEILKGTDRPSQIGGRREIVLPILNDKGHHLRVLYDYDGKKTSKCQLVTLTF